MTVYDNEGLADISFHYWDTNPRGRSRTVWPEIGFGYGFTSRWYSKVFISNVGPKLLSTSLESLNWQNDYRLTQGQYPFDLALHTNLALYRDTSKGKTLEIGPAFQTDLGRFQINANLFLERAYQVQNIAPTQLNYQWQVKYRIPQGLHFGLQGFGELGDWNHWAPGSHQSHRAGPMAAFVVPLGNAQEIRLQAAYLTGKTFGRSGSMFTARAQYVF